MQQTHGHDFNRRLEELGWAFFLIFIGAIWLFPAGAFPPETWLIGAGVILLALNAVRYVRHLPVSAATIVLGILALAAGVSPVFGVNLPVLAILLIVLGAAILLKPLAARKN